LFLRLSLGLLSVRFDTDGQINNFAQSEHGILSGMPNHMFFSTTLHGLLEPGDRLPVIFGVKDGRAGYDHIGPGLTN
jgi:hypothetical protein